MLSLTFPVWGWFKDDLKKKWLSRQPDQYVNAELDSDRKAFEEFNWIITGLTWAANTFVLMTIIFYLTGNLDMSITYIAVLTLLWIAGGLLFGYVVTLFLGKRVMKKTYTQKNRSVQIHFRP